MSQGHAQTGTGSNPAQSPALSAIGNFEEGFRSFFRFNTVGPGVTSPEKRWIALNGEIDDAAADTWIAEPVSVPVALVINELISNAIRHRAAQIRAGSAWHGLRRVGVTFPEAARKQPDTGTALRESRRTP